METITYCDICDAEDVPTFRGVCAPCWLISISPDSGVFDYRACLLRVMDDPPERMTIGAFIAAHPGVLTEDDAVALMVDGATVWMRHPTVSPWTLRMAPEDEAV